MATALCGALPTRAIDPASKFFSKLQRELATMALEHAWKGTDSESLRQLHGKIQAARHELGFDFASRQKELRPQEFVKRWTETLPRVKAVSVDIFDTALVRCLMAPNDVFLFLKEVPPFADLSLSSGQIYELRQQAEHEARAKLLKERGSVEVTLAEIYAGFAAKAGSPFSHVADFVAAEQTVELAMCRAHPLIQELLRQAVEQNKSLCFVSDTFHSRDFLHSLLTQSGYSPAPDLIFASCDYREGKYTGRLLLEACRKLGLPPGEVAHLGDNPESDEKGARTAGMTSLLHPCAVSSTVGHLHHAVGARRSESIVRGTALAISSRPHEKSFWFKLGCETFGPLLTSFVLWLIERWRRDKIEQVFFLLRDGLVLHQIYDLLRETQSDLPPAQLLYSSRRAFAVPALACEQTRNIDPLLVSGNRRPAGEFLSRLDLDPAQFAAAFREAGFESSDEIVDHRGDPGRILRLFRHPSVLAALSRRALVERKLLVRYLEQQNVIGNRPTALVDIGWNNTVQKSLLAILDQEKISHQLHGYYLGTLGEAQDFQLRDYRYDSFLCHDGEPVALSHPIAACRVLLEIVCTSFEGSLRSFTKAAGKIEAVLDPSDMAPFQSDILHAIHAGILCYAQAVAANRFARGLREISPEVARARRRRGEFNAQTSRRLWSEQPGSPGFARILPERLLERGAARIGFRPVDGLAAVGGSVALSENSADQKL
jgi:predicted HAD superfamily hydrolase